MLLQNFYNASPSRMSVTVIGAQISDPDAVVAIRVPWRYPRHRQHWLNPESRRKKVLRFGIGDRPITSRRNNINASCETFGNPTFVLFTPAPVASQYT